MVQHSEPMIDSPNPIPIIQILENVMNLVDSEHPIGETNNDQRQLEYIGDSKQPPPLNTMLEPPIDVSTRKDSSTSSLDSDTDLINALGLKLVFIKLIQVIPLKIFTTEKP